MKLGSGFSPDPTGAFVKPDPDPSGHHLEDDESLLLIAVFVDGKVGPRTFSDGTVSRGVNNCLAIPTDCRPPKLGDPVTIGG